MRRGGNVASKPLVAPDPPKAGTSDEWINGPTPSASGSQWEPKYERHTSAKDMLDYRTFITISGPKGVLYK